MLIMRVGENEILTVEEVAKILGIHQHTVRKYIKQGVIKGFSKVGAFLIPATEVEKFKKIKKEWLTMEEVQKKLGVSRTTVWSWVKQGILKPVKIGRFLYFRPEEVEELLGRKKDKST
jgi:excisionase family DNA binding protein